jgi:hypothetical protein
MRTAIECLVGLRAGRVPFLLVRFLWASKENEQTLKKEQKKSLQETRNQGYRPKPNAM